MGSGSPNSGIGGHSPSPPYHPPQRAWLDPRGAWETAPTTVRMPVVASFTAAPSSCECARVCTTAAVMGAGSDSVILSRSTGPSPGLPAPNQLPSQSRIASSAPPEMPSCSHVMHATDLCFARGHSRGTVKSNLFHASPRAITGMIEQLVHSRDAGATCITLCLEPFYGPFANPWCPKVTGVWPPPVEGPQH
jgi:hypothetical protein